MQNVASIRTGWYFSLRSDLDLDNGSDSDIIRGIRCKSDCYSSQWPDVRYDISLQGTGLFSCRKLLPNGILNRSLDSSARR